MTEGETMATTTYSDMTAASTLHDDDVFAVDQHPGDNSRKVKLSQVAGYVESEVVTPAVAAEAAAREAAEALLAPLESPVFTGAPTVPQPGTGSNNGQAAPTKWVMDRIDEAVTGGITPPFSVEQGGTGATAAAEARANLGVTAALAALDIRIPAGNAFTVAPFIVASDKRKLVIKAGSKIVVGSRTFHVDEDEELDIEELLDTGVLKNGKDYYIFLCPGEELGSVIVSISLTKTNPQEFDPADVLLIGGFHTLCVNAGTGMTYVEGGVTKDHPLNGFIAGDILPNSVWCLNHRPFSEPEGMVYIPSLDFWCDIYLQSGSGANTKSAYQGAITRNRQYVDFVEDMFCVRKELLDDGEFAAAMLGSNEQTAVSGASESGATSGGAGGRKDTATRRMISVHGVEEGCGSLWQWLRTTSVGGMAGTIYGQTDTTPTYGTFTMTASAYGPHGQAGGKGSFWGLAGALLAGGNWNNSTNCGSRARNTDSARSAVGLILGGRGRSRTMR
jgi:hypothetical protein